MDNVNESLVLESALALDQSYLLDHDESFDRVIKPRSSRGTAGNSNFDGVGDITIGEISAASVPIGSGQLQVFAFFGFSLHCPHPTARDARPSRTTTTATTSHPPSSTKRKDKRTRGVETTKVIYDSIPEEPEPTKSLRGRTSSTVGPSLPAPAPVPVPAPTSDSSQLPAPSKRTTESAPKLPPGRPHTIRRSVSSFHAIPTTSSNEPTLEVPKAIPRPTSALGLPGDSTSSSRLKRPISWSGFNLPSSAAVAASLVTELKDATSSQQPNTLKRTSSLTRRGSLIPEIRLPPEKTKHDSKTISVQPASLLLPPSPEPTTSRLPTVSESRTPAPTLPPPNTLTPPLPTMDSSPMIQLLGDAADEDRLMDVKLDMAKSRTSEEGMRASLSPSIPLSLDSRRPQPAADSHRPLSQHLSPVEPHPAPPEQKKPTPHKTIAIAKPHPVIRALSKRLSTMDTDFSSYPPLPPSPASIPPLDERDESPFRSRATPSPSVRGRAMRDERKMVDVHLAVPSASDAAPLPNPNSNSIHHPSPKLGERRTSVKPLPGKTEIAKDKENLAAKGKPVVDVTRRSSVSAAVPLVSAQQVNTTKSTLGARDKDGVKSSTKEISEAVAVVDRTRRGSVLFTREPLARAPSIRRESSRPTPAEIEVRSYPPLPPSPIPPPPPPKDNRSVATEEEQGEVVVPRRPINPREKAAGPVKRHDDRSVRRATASSSDVAPLPPPKHRSAPVDEPEPAKLERKTSVKARPVISKVEPKKDKENAVSRRRSASVPAVVARQVTTTKSTATLREKAKPRPEPAETERGRLPNRRGSILPTQSRDNLSKPSTRPSSMILPNHPPDPLQPLSHLPIQDINLNPAPAVGQQFFLAPLAHDESTDVSVPAPSSELEVRLVKDVEVLTKGAVEPQVPTLSTTAARARSKTREPTVPSKNHTVKDRASRQPVTNSTVRGKTGSIRGASVAESSRRRSLSAPPVPPKDMAKLPVTRSDRNTERRTPRKVAVISRSPERVPPSPGNALRMETRVAPHETSGQVEGRGVSSFHHPNQHEAHSRSPSPISKPPAQEPLEFGEKQARKRLLGTTSPSATLPSKRAKITAIIATVTSKFPSSRAARPAKAPAHRPVVIPLSTAGKLPGDARSLRAKERAQKEKDAKEQEEKARRELRRKEIGRMPHLDVPVRFACFVAVSLLILLMMMSKACSAGTSASQTYATSCVHLLVGSSSREA
jgi:hypothetical protein